MTTNGSPTRLPGDEGIRPHKKKPASKQPRANVPSLIAPGIIPVHRLGLVCSHLLPRLLRIKNAPVHRLCTPGGRTLLVANGSTSNIAPNAPPIAQRPITPSRQRSLRTRKVIFMLRRAGYKLRSVTSRVISGRKSASVVSPQSPFFAWRTLTLCTAASFSPMTSM